MSDDIKVPTTFGDVKVEIIDCRPERIYIVTIGICENDQVYPYYRSYRFRTRCQPEEVLSEIERQLYPQMLEDCRKGPGDGDISDKYLHPYIHFILPVT